MKKLVIVWVGLVICGAVPARALESYTDLTAYNAAVGPHTVIDFTGLAAGTIPSDQYAGLGVVFTDGDDRVRSESAFVTDEKGVDGFGQIHLTFTSPVNTIGAEFPGGLTIDLYNGETLVGTSGDLGGAGAGFFGGVSGIAFDRAVLRDPVDDRVFIDNLHFGVNGGVIPAPGAVVLGIVGAALTGWLRRRRGL
jgi:hypothetical protein